MEYDTACTLPHIEDPLFKQHLEHSDNQRLFQFLMGLNESYSNIRSNLLLWTPLPSLNQAYGIHIQEESQRDVSAIISSECTNIGLNVGATGNESKVKKNVNSNFECDFCKKKYIHLTDATQKTVIFARKRDNARTTVFKYRDNLKGKLPIKANTASVREDGDAAGNAPLISGKVTFTAEQFYLLMKKCIGGSNSVANTVTTYDNNVTAAGPLKWESLGKW